MCVATGDMPIILACDGPSLGGFVCPATTILADMWKWGQARPGDKMQFVLTTVDSAVEQLRLQRARFAAVKTAAETGAAVDESALEVRTRFRDIFLHLPWIVLIDDGRNHVERLDRLFCLQQRMRAHDNFRSTGTFVRGCVTKLENLNLLIDE